MSLLIVGSCSKITQNIVLALARQSQYQKITIDDVLPAYDFHRRFYKLKRSLKDQKSNTEISINKIIKYDDLYHHIKQHNDILYVTHDYFQNAVSKTKLMELTATYSKNKSNVVFATPIEYDHYGYQNPEQNYLESQARVREINKNAIVVRSDVQDLNEIYSYIGKSKRIWEDLLLKVPDSFKPKVVGSTFYAEKVAEALKSGTKGQVVCVRGERERHTSEVQHNRHLQDIEIEHHKQNIQLMVSKYRGPEDKTSRIISYKH